jgi:hypothetical protein
MKKQNPSHIPRLCAYVRPLKPPCNALLLSLAIIWPGRTLLVFFVLN